MGLPAAAVLLQVVIGILSLSMTAAGAPILAGGFEGSSPDAMASVCSVPGGRFISAVEVPPGSGLGAQSLDLFGSIGDIFDEAIDTTFGSFFSFFGRRLLQTAPPCCPAQTVTREDTLASLANNGGLPVKSGVHLIQFYNNMNTTALNPGDTITVPCPRVINYLNQRIEGVAAPAPAPAPGLAPLSAPTGAAAPAAV